MKKLNKLKFKFTMAGLACVLSLVCCPKLAFAMENENEIVAGSFQENLVVESNDNLAEDLENLKAQTNVVKKDSTEASGKLTGTENSITESALKPENLIVEAGGSNEKVGQSAVGLTLSDSSKLVQGLSDSKSQASDIFESNDNLAKNLENLKAPTNVVKNDSTEASGKLMDTENSITESALKPENLIVEAGGSNEKVGQSAVGLTLSDSSKLVQGLSDSKSQASDIFESNDNLAEDLENLKVPTNVVKKDSTEASGKLTGTENSVTESALKPENLIVELVDKALQKVVDLASNDRVGVAKNDQNMNYLWCILPKYANLKKFSEIFSIKVSECGQGYGKTVSEYDNVPMMEFAKSELFNGFIKHYFKKFGENIFGEKFKHIRFEDFKQSFIENSKFLKNCPKILEIEIGDKLKEGGEYRFSCYGDVGKTAHVFSNYFSCVDKNKEIKKLVDDYLLFYICRQKNKNRSVAEITKCEQNASEIESFLEGRFEILDNLLKKSLFKFDSLFIYQLNKNDLSNFYYIFSENFYNDLKPDLERGEIYVEISSCKKNEKGSELKETSVFLDEKVSLTDMMNTEIFKEYFRRFFEEMHLSQLGISFERFMLRFVEKFDLLKKFPKFLKFSLDKNLVSEIIFKTIMQGVDCNIKFYKYENGCKKVFLEFPFKGWYKNCVGTVSLDKAKKTPLVSSCDMESQKQQNKHEMEAAVSNYAAKTVEFVGDYRNERRKLLTKFLSESSAYFNKNKDKYISSLKAIKRNFWGNTVSFLLENAPYIFDCRFVGDDVGADELQKENIIKEDVGSLTDFLKISNKNFNANSLNDRIKEFANGYKLINGYVEYKLPNDVRSELEKSKIFVSRLGEKQFRFVFFIPYSVCKCVDNWRFAAFNTIGDKQDLDKKKFLNEEFGSLNDLDKLFLKTNFRELYFPIVHENIQKDLVDRICQVCGHEKERIMNKLNLCLNRSNIDKDYCVVELCVDCRNSRPDDKLLVGVYNENGGCRPILYTDMLDIDLI